MQIRREESNMMTLDEITKKVLEQIDASGFKQSGAFNLRHNGIALCHGDSELSKLRKSRISRASTFISMVRQMEKKYIFRSL